MSRSIKIRLDQLLVLRGLAESRQRAQAIIMAGKVVVSDHRIDKPGVQVDHNAKIRLKGSDHPFVSRAGVKINGALDAFSLDVSGMVALDVGASTGGFTDCLLQRGAAKVYAIDVGRGQLHEKIRKDNRVVSLEGINARYLSPDAISERVDLVVMDVSFISLKLVLQPVLHHLNPGGDIVALVKPQFEVGRGLVGKGGIVTNPEHRKNALDDVCDFARSLGLTVDGQHTSDLPGADGNIEIFIWLKNQVDGKL